jgi:hypothetical protein
MGLRRRGIARSHVSAAECAIRIHRALPTFCTVAKPADTSSLTTRESVIGV